MTDVLVVDDHPAMREMLRMVLDDAGYDVTTVTDGRCALNHLLAATRRTVALVDLLLPDMTGIEVLQEVERDRALACEHAYLLMTAHHRALPDAAAAVLAALHAPVLFKPFDLDVLFETVAHLAYRSAPAR